MAIAMASALIFPGTGRAQIETLVMPGEVIEGHAELEAECSNCHKAFDRARQRVLCLDCHEDVAADVKAVAGYHGLFDDARSDECSSCHTDHKGRNANIVQLTEASFDHQFTDFELLGAHLQPACADCHAPDTLHRDAPGACNDCHNDDDVHKETLGTNCADCHQSTEWNDATFDHDMTDYPLLGKHQEAACLDCHEDSTYQNAPTTCFGCHSDDDAHDGRSGQECDTCHNPTDWHDSSFDHTRDTEFVLEGRHAQLTCDDCHTDNPFQDEMDKTCVWCHLEDDQHSGHNGDNCGSCHNNSDWAETLFDHDRDTDYDLHGAHQTIACADCHVEAIFEVELKTTCESCHLEDEVHEGALGKQCENCHAEISWQDPVFFDHDLTKFPRLGLHREPECDDCHASQVFTDTESECVSCHLEVDPHDGHFEDSCGACHNPVAWDIWTFDHNVQTEFVLEGAHAVVACDDCHRSGLAKMKGIDGSCISCHRASDIHDGEFGADCGRCHSAESFIEVRSLQ